MSASDLESLGFVPRRSTFPGLPRPPKDWAGRPATVVRSAAQIVQKSDYEHAGRAYHFRVAGPIKVTEEANETGSSKMEEFAAIKKKVKKNVKLHDYYGLLGLQAENVFATVDQIKENYRAVSLLFHPDKSDPAERDHAEARFKAMQKAHEVLTDEKQRRVYDSSLPFDDSVPEEKDGATEETFFKTYLPVFKRNERFSTVLPCPQLGDMETPIEQVDAFYDFWLSKFKSWRDFSHDDETKINEGMCREEKRQAQRENEKLRAAAKKEEVARVQKFVEGAMRKDPRIKLARVRAEEEKKRKKEEKRNKLYAAQNEAARLKAEEEARIAAEAAKKIDDEKTAKRRKEEIKTMKKIFKKQCKNGQAGEFKDDEIEQLIAAFDYFQFKTALDKFSSGQSFATAPKGVALSAEEAAGAREWFYSQLRVARGEESAVQAAASG